MPRPKRLTEPHQRETARRIRDHHWRVLERAGELDPLWCCWWDKRGFHKPPAVDVESFCLLSGMEFLDWIQNDHPDWVEIGEWDDERYAAPVRLTAAGRDALAHRERYDMEPVRGGLVNPGWEAIPAEGGTRAES